MVLPDCRGSVRTTARDRASALAHSGQPGTSFRNLEYPGALRRILEPLRNIEYFRRFVVHPGLGTLVWPNGADFAPEFLRESIAVAA